MANGHTCRHISICIKREKEDEEKIRAQYMRVKNEMLKEAKKGAKNSSCPEFCHSICEKYTVKPVIIFLLIFFYPWDLDPYPVS